MKVGIVGAGAIAHGICALLDDEGHEVRIWSPSNRDLHNDVEFEGAISRKLTVSHSSSAQDLAASSELIVFALPANGHKSTMDAIYPHLTAEHECVVSAHLSFSAEYLGSILKNRGVELTISAWDTTPLVCKPIAPARYNVVKIRKSIGVNWTSEAQKDYATTKAGTVFPNTFRRVNSLLELTFNNLNPEVHMGMALCNITRMEQGETWCQNKNVTQSVGRLIEALDDERLKIARAYDIEALSIFEDHQSLGLEGRSVFEDHQTLHERTPIWGPKTGETRYVLEDAPFGLAVLVKLGEQVGLSTPIHTAGLTLLSALYERNFEAENNLISHDLLKSLLTR